MKSFHFVIVYTFSGSVLVSTLISSEHAMMISGCGGMEIEEITSSNNFLHLSFGLLFGGGG
jgi:hypothetical protein